MFASEDQQICSISEKFELTNFGRICKDTIVITHGTKKFVRVSESLNYRVLTEKDGKYDSPDASRQNMFDMTGYKYHPVSLSPTK